MAFPRAILFDLDGTLVDTARDFVRIIQSLCIERGLAPPQESQIRQQVSAGSLAMVELFAKGDEALHLKEEFLRRYADEICVDSRLYEGLDDLLEFAESVGLPWGVVTNKPRALATKLLKALALDHRCGVLVCPEDVTVHKPDPEGLMKAARVLGVSETHCWYVGDHARDIEAGARAHMTTVAALYGYVEGAEANALAAMADCAVEKSSDLLPMLLSGQ